ncbi:MarR family transcriptional regulator [Brachybacterium vulturis]|uniref:MarR family transcriptional regulator n=1 Tax=Brachybacterium vulturis TaxID=2017484 RepID=A0A291GPF5_9MICO|nr:MarR family transcriptional regulator [Brachybacterium vulturis]ATG52131.1 MarR family transcriptional regulator [Brachybacterium vulturis]
MSSSRRAEDGRDQPAAPPPLFSIGSSDPGQELVDRRGLDDRDIAQIDALMAALARLRDAEQELTDASLRYMQLGRTDMRALHFLIVCENTGTLATPGAITQALGISSASTTKLLDRLEDAGHVRRARHPSDRRALVITIEPSTRSEAMRTVGTAQARRVDAVRRLLPAEREIVTGFLEDMAAQISVDGVDWSACEDAGSES